MQANCEKGLTTCDQTALLISSFASCQLLSFACGDLLSEPANDALILLLTPAYF